MTTPKAKLSVARVRAAAAMHMVNTSPTARLIDDGGVLRLDLSGGTSASPHFINVDRLKLFSSLADAVVAALVRHASLATVRTVGGRRRLYNNLSGSFFRFLESTGRAGICAAEIDEAVGAAFIKWLNEPSSDGKLRAPATRRANYMAFVQMVELWSGDLSAGSTISHTSLPQNPWPGAQKTIKGTAPLDRDDIRLIARHCAAAVRRVSAEIETDLHLVRSKPATGQSLRQQILKRLLSLEPADQAFTLVRKRDPSLAANIQNLGRDSIYRFLHPSLQDLIPFMVILAIVFRFNESVLITSKLGDYERARWIGGDRIVGRPMKPRAGRRQTASAAITDDAVNPSRMLALIEGWTEQIRRTKPSDDLFIFWAKKGRARGVVTFGERSVNWAQTLHKSFRRFAADNNLPSFTITQIRHTMIDLAHEISDGDRALVRAAGGQRSLNVVEDHYVTAAGRQRDEERLARSLVKRQLAAATSGKYDARRQSENCDTTAAVTPGWKCSAMGGSPFAGDRTDGLCVSFGRCPVCEHGSTDYRSTHCAAQNLELLGAIDRSMETMPPEAWLGQLAPIRSHLLGEILPRFGEDVLSAAENIYVPKMPTLE